LSIYFEVLSGIVGSRYPVERKPELIAIFERFSQKRRQLNILYPAVFNLAYEVMVIAVKLKRSIGKKLWVDFNKFQKGQKGRVIENLIIGRVRGFELYAEIRYGKGYQIPGCHIAARNFMRSEKQFHNLSFLKISSGNMHACQDGRSNRG
jgi:hypothetical protein